MKRLRSRPTYRKTVATLVVIGALAVPLAVADAASATLVTVGRPLTGTFVSSSGGNFLATNTAFPGAGGQVLSPVSGVIVRWNLIRGSGTLKLGVLHPNGTTYTLTRTSDSVSPLSTGKESFATQLPVAAGEAVGLEVGPGSTVGLTSESGGKTAFWEPPLSVGQTLAPTGTGSALYGFNAEVLPPPVISSISATSGPSTGGTLVTISGDNFVSVSSVKFGASAASAFSVGSEGTIDAVAPAGTDSVAVTVTTVAGMAVSPQSFSYSVPAPPVGSAPVGLSPTCRVPKLKGRTLKSAKKRIRAADCRLGKLTKKEGATAKDGEVVKQVPKPGATVPANTKVKVTLAP
jgi:large repetitive protein